MANLAGGVSGAVGGAVGGTLVGGALGGAAAGSIVPGIGTLIGAGVGLLSGLFGGDNSAAQDIANAQLEEARKNRGLAMGAATPTMQELQMMSMQYNQAAQQMNYLQSELSRTTQLLNAIDPNIMESSKQVHDMMTGGKSAWMAPIERERQRGRQAMEAKLANTLGAGYAGTTAGQQALNEYDRQTGELLSQAQLQGITQLTGVGSAYSGMAGAAANQLNQSQGMAGNLAQSYMASQGSISNRMINAINATPTTPYAGAQFTGAYLQNQQNQAALGNLGNLGVAAIGALGKSGGGGGVIPEIGNQFSSSLTMPTMKF